MPPASAPPWWRALAQRVRPGVAPHIALGRRGEKLAARYLRRRARLRVLGRNVRTRGGEIDLVCEDARSGAIVVVEVKTRAPGQTIPAEAAIHRDKQRRLLASARALRRERGWADRPIRIDVVAIDFEPGRHPDLRHYPNAVNANPIR